MSESKFEAVSLLVDNYRQSDAALDAALVELIEDEQLSDTWDRYHLIGDVIRGDVSSNITIDLLEQNLSGQIAQAIAEEATVLAPVNKIEKASNFKAKIVNLFKPVGQFAIAASAAGLMIVGVQQNVAQNDPQYDRITPSQVVQTVPFGGVADPVSFNYQQPNRNAQRQAYLEQQRRFQALLSDHQRQIKLISAVKTVKNKSTIQQKAADTPK